MRTAVWCGISAALSAGIVLILQQLPWAGVPAQAQQPPRGQRMVSQSVESGSAEDVEGRPIIQDALSDIPAPARLQRRGTCS
jgi:hypothetical protein